MTTQQNPSVTETPDNANLDERVRSRAALSVEERRGGSDDPLSQAAAILAESDERAIERDRFPLTTGEHRTSDEASEG